MNSLIFILVFIHYGAYPSNAGYYSAPYDEDIPQSDVQAPAYVPSYMKNRQFSKTSYSRSYGSGGGTKTGYGGTKTGYAGTKTGYAGTKTGYAGTKTGYSSYTGTKTWASNTGGAANYEEFQENANRPYQPLCEPECKNNGICVDTNTCHCAADFHGKYCEMERKPCLTLPPQPANSRVKCSSDLCQVSCLAGHKFFDGSTVANLRCAAGQWVPTRADLTSLTDCVPECSPACLNGGVCLSVNTCQCPQEYRGPQCQYSASQCDAHKLAFNGGYSCAGDGERFSCQLSCPPGSSFSTPVAEAYTCLYSTGRFEPQPIPHCVFNEVVIITPSNYHHTYNETYYETTYHNKTSYSESHSKHTGQTEIEDMNESTLYNHQHAKKPHHVVIQELTPIDGTCLTWAGAHYKTFDGKIYSFLSACQHVLFRDAQDHKFTVSVKHHECKSAYYCPSELSIFVEDKEYFLSVGEEGSVVFRSSRRLIPVPAQLPQLSVVQREDVIITLGSVATLTWDTNNLITIVASVSLWNNTEGLCGRLDGVPANDFLTRDGVVASTKSAFVASWQVNRVGDTCDSGPTEVNACVSKTDEDMRKAKQFCTKVFSKDKFRKCSAVMDVSMLLDTCQWDYCACTMTLSPEECACKTVAVYAKECQRHGVEEMKLWRDADTCPMHCPDGKIYKSCGPESQPTCAFPLISSKTDNNTCVEGCFCPDGLLLEGGKCVPKGECPCRLRKKAFPPGATVKKDCNTCTCDAGEWVCTKVPCGARCGAVGDPHYTTFDGLRYDFMGHCSYNMLSAANLTVEVENVACSGAITEAMNLTPVQGSDKPSCTKSVTIAHGGATVHLKQGGFVLVNGKEIQKLPVHVREILIRAASSLFIIVQLPNGVDVWWDGNTRVYIDVPAEFQGKTKGLCGTFNLNQKDDFLTPEGDIEQSTQAFANKWKTREACADLDLTEPEHPCKAHVENKEAAEKYCGKLKSKLFEPCHWYVDVAPYYEACLYDMCACEGDASQCVCAAIADYAAACAPHYPVHWRYEVKECELSCTGGQEYTVCADSCLRTCADVSLGSTRKCRPHCVEGCACPASQVLDDSGSCVPVGLCPCFHKGLEFKPGYKEVRPGRREREICTCIGARWDCQPASPQDIQNYPPAEDLMQNCTAAHHMEFTTCMAPEVTCKNMHLPPSQATSECRAGCQCVKGYVLDMATKKCVLPETCPCHHGGESYPDSHTITEECNTCTCKSGNWSCTQRACAGVCAAWGDSHIATFDGNEYDFEGVCSYLLAKGCMEAGKDGFEVEIQNEPCGTTGATCSKSVTLKVGGGDDPEEMVRLTKNEALPEINKLKRIKMRLAGAFVFLDVPSLGMSLQWDRAMRVYVKVDAMWQNRVKGLCGNYNSDMRDDFQTPTGGIAETSALIFADSWKLKTTCPKPRPVTDHCQQRPERKDWATTTCGVLKHYPFTLCHSEVPPSAHIERCARDACACDAGDDCACACAAIAAYAHACVARGVVFKWRTKDLCPMQCDEECSNYEACISPCPPETCDNTLYYEEVKVVCEKDTCVEGCKLKNSTCPPGQVFSNSSLTQCVPRQQCRPPCMTLQDGTKLLEGELIEEDACHTCRCSKGEKVCTGQPCPTDAPTIPPTESSPKPHDEPLKCVTGWTPWVNQAVAETTSTGSMDVEPLPKLKDFQIGSPMCKPESMKKIECRTVKDHRTPKDTGLNVECSLEKGLICKEMTDANSNVTCPDFEIRVYCECEEEPFQCLNSTHPNHAHPTDCTKFYECIPNPMSPEKPHAVLKTCGEGLMYNPEAMVCDWPAAVEAVRPECRNYSKESREFKTTVTPTTVTWATGTVPSTTPRLCPSGQVYKECAFPCDKLCDHFKKTLADQGKCLPGQKCIEGCVDEAVANIKCDFGSLWRDEKTCVPMKDCTCLSNEGRVMKPGATSTDGCIKCQCLDNVLHCDSSECVKIIVPISGSTHEPYIFTTHTILTTASTTEIPTTTEEVKSTTAEVTTTTVKSTMEVPSTTAAPTTVIIVKSTASPPPLCTEDRYKNLLWDGEPLPDSSFTASSVANALFEPQFAVLNGHPLDITAGSWNPSSQDLNQFIQVELPQTEPLYGVLMQGSPLFDQYVTSYEVMYGDDGHTFSTVKGPDGENKVFRGPTDHNNPIKQMFNPPIEAKFVRIHPLTWHEEIAVRWELIGCEEHADTTDTPVVTTVTTPAPIQCTDLLGLSAGLPVDNIEVSSNNDARKYLDLTSERGWRPLYSTPGEWLMFDFTEPRNITGIKTKGGEYGWVTSYNIMHTSDLTRFNPVIDDTGSTRSFPANFDKDTVVVNEFRPPIHARYLKVLPMKWKDNIEMRIEPVGCFEPYPTLPPTTTTESPQTTEVDNDCLICPGFVRPDDLECSCDAPSQYYDGENCVSRDQCPCFVGYMSYAVGSSFRGDKCDECVCKLGGVTDCKPVKQCDCAPNLVPNLSQTTCECTCKPCPVDTKICPTSKLCLPLDKWCDGLQDCPDDERNCTVPTTITTTVEPVVVTTVRPVVEAVPTTVAPKLPCPPVECPPGYTVQLLSAHHQYSYSSELPPPRARRTYARFFKGQAPGATKRGYSKGGFSKGGYSNIPSPPKSTQAFTLDKPQVQNPKSQVEACQQFKCVPKLPPYRPGVHHPPQVCSTPQCPPKYKLQIDTSTHDRHKCPQYVCVPPPDRPVYCELTGRTFNTFDGSEYKYDVCFHILARDNRFDAWTVLVRKKCRVDGCLNELLIRQDDQLILIKPDMTIEYDNYEYTVEQTSMICFQKNSFDLARLGTGVVVKSRKYNFTVAFNTDGDVKVGVSKSLSGSVDGLCGYFDGASFNDRRLPSGRPATSVDAFGRAWAKPGLSPNACQTKVIDKERQQEAWNLCDVVTKEPLSRCGSALNLDKWRSMCLEKICTCSELVVNGTKRSQEECRCLLLEQFVAECRKEMAQVDLADWRTLYRCPAECPAPLVHYSCYQRVCEPSCSPQPHAGCPTDARQCVPGCYCPEGTLRLKDSCVAVDQCLDCNCNSAGNKYMTFEGDDMPFEHNCTYLVSRDRNDTGVHKYQIYATNAPCEKNNAAVCTKVVKLLHEKHIVRVEKNPSTKKLQVMIDEEVVFKYPQKKDWVTISLVNGQDVKVLLPDEHVELTVSPSDLSFSVKVPSSLYSNATQGLCGVCAGYQEHLVMSNGTATDDYGQYAKSWQAKGEILTALKIADQEQCDEPPPKEECVPPPLELNPCNKLYDTQMFGACHALVDPASHVENCEADLCTNNTDICTVLERYAAECRRQGVCLQWRGQLCPWTCESPFIYRPCVGCDLTCDNYDEMKDGCDKPYLEGCYCPEGKVRVNNTCIEPSKCFPCDTNKEHYAGDEWQEDACTKCACSKLDSSPMAHITCNKQTCSEPACADNEDLIAKPAPGACCREYVCVPKPIAIKCDEPKQIECGFGQVLKLKTKSDGCTEFACECKPADECDPIPPESKLEPGMTRDIDSTGCCPKEVITCRKETCPPPPECPKFHDVKSANVTGVCCLQYTCELPKDKCVVTLEWEAAPKGGEKLRAEPETLLKDLDEAWLDGPCRSCRCSPPLPAASCLVSSCPPAVSDDKFLVEPRPAPFACCPSIVQVACRDGNKIYKVGEKWSSPGNVCEHHECVQLEDGKLDKLTTVQMCDTKCQPGWQYTPPSSDSGECCGQCSAVACVVDGAEHQIGSTWVSPDHCTNYTCMDVNGTLQVQSSNESCPAVTDDMKNLYVFEETAVPGKCCKNIERVACRDGDKIYQEGQTWNTSDPCVTIQCVRANSSELSRESLTQHCAECGSGFERVPGGCCGHCRPTSCLTEDGMKDIGATWASPDNCTTFSCLRSDGLSVLVSSSRVSCPRVDDCPPADLVNETCCQVCKMRPQNLKPETCKPEPLPDAESVGIVRRRLGRHGLCRNMEPLPRFRECRGSCTSGTLYNNQTGSHDTRCECCQAVKYESLLVTLRCEDGSAQAHRVASPARCDCRACGEIGSMQGLDTHGYSGIKSPTKTGYSKKTPNDEIEEIEIPEIYKRFGEADDMNRVRR